MARPFFSLAKSKRVTPIDFRMGETWIIVEATPGARHGDNLGCRCAHLGREPDRRGPRCRPADLPADGDHAASRSLPSSAAAPAVTITTG